MGDTNEGVLARTSASVISNTWLFSQQVRWSCAAKDNGIESLFYFNSRCVEVEPRQPKAWPRAGFSHDCAIRANTLGPVVTIWFTIWDFGKNALEAGNFLPRSNCLKTYANEEKNVCEWGNPCIGSDWVTPHSHRCEWKLCSSVAQINMLVNALSSVHGHRTIIFASHNAASRP